MNSKILEEKSSSGKKFEFFGDSNFFPLELFSYTPNVIPRDVIVRAVDVLVVLVAIINELRSYLGF